MLVAGASLTCILSLTNAAQAPQLIVPTGEGAALAQRAHEAVAEMDARGIRRDA